MLVIFQTHTPCAYSCGVKSATVIGDHSRPGFCLELENGKMEKMFCYDYYQFLLLHNFANDDDTILKIKIENNQLKIQVDDQEKFFKSIYANNYIMYLGAKIEKSFDIKTILEHDISQKSTIDVKFPKLGIELFTYQKNTIRWMHSLENQNQAYKFNISTSLKKIEPNINVDYYFNSITKRTTEEPQYLHFKTKGGILADEMGLGKTLMSICACLVDSYKPTEKIKDGLFQSKATMIIVPSHLAHQWINDMQKFTGKLNIICLTTKNDHKNLTYDDFMNADFVIVTHQFLSNLTYYISLPYDNKKITATTLDYSDRKQTLTNIIKDLTTNKKFQDKSVHLEAIKWRRMIIDEGHELVGKLSDRIENYLTLWLTDINSDFNWIVSGTPFTNKKNFLDMMQFIKFDVKYNSNWVSIKDLERNITVTNYIAISILESIMNKNTKNKVKNELEIPDYTNEIVKIVMTNMEQSLYDSKAMHKSYDKTLLRQLCCHPMIADQQWNVFGEKSINLDDIKDQVIKSNKNKMLDYQNKLTKLDPKAQEYNMLKKTYENIISEANFLLKVFDDSEEAIVDDDECPICRCPIDELVITKCGHKFCKDCIEEALKYTKGSKQCPLCASQLKPDEIYHKKSLSSSTDKVNPLVSKYGSKLGILISYCRKLILNPKNRIILFSQFDRMLQLIGMTLASNGVENTIIKGNVYQRKKAIHKFKNSEDTTPVMLLSMDHAASGTDLSNTTHIIFIDPIDAPIEDVKAIEGQCIARAHRINQKEKIKVIRMITSNTIEEDIWKKLNPKSSLVSTMVMDA